MNKILVATFDSEQAAFEGVSALKDLHRDGDISLYASSVIAKDGDGRYAVRQAADAGPLGTVVGIVGGSLVGLLGGPAGALLGGWLGGSAGLMYDLFSVGVGADLVEDVGSSLAAGKVAVVADIDEGWSTPVDTRLESLGATLFRRYPGEVADEQLAREADAAEADMEQLRAELKQADGEAKASIEARIGAQRDKIEALIKRLDAALANEQARIDARLETLRSQLATARAEQHKRIEARMDEAKAAHKVREEKLAEAREHAKAALELTGEAILG